MKDRLRVLIIAPYFAPNSEVASVRMLSLSKYLYDQGNDVTVLCYSEEMLLRERSREDLKSPIPEYCKIVRFSLNKKNPYLADIQNGKEFKRILSTMIDFNKYDVALITCGPYFTLDAVSVLKKAGLKVILDFRDLGAINYRPDLRAETYASGRIMKKIYRSIMHKLVYLRERKAVKLSDFIIAISSIDRDYMMEAYKIDDAKIAIATNGFDEEKLRTIIPIQKASREIQIGIFGKFMYYSEKRAISILKIVNELRQQGIAIKVVHIGKKYDWIDQKIIENGISSDCYQSLGLMDYAKGMSILGSVDFFAVEDTSPDDIGTKIYDYIYWNKPVVAAVPSNIPLARLVQKFEFGYACDNEEEIRNAIYEIIEKKATVLDSHINVNEYSRVHQNSKILHFMQEIVLK